MYESVGWASLFSSMTWRSLHALGVPAAVPSTAQMVYTQLLIELVKVDLKKSV